MYRGHQAIATAPLRRFGREGGYVLHTLTRTKRDALPSSLARAFKGGCNGYPEARVLSEAEAEGAVRGVVWRAAVLSRLTQMCGIRFSPACSFKVMIGDISSASQNEVAIRDTG